MNNNYLKIFLSVLTFTALGFGMTLGYRFLRMADDMFNIGGIALITVVILGAFYIFHLLWIKPIPKDKKLFESENKQSTTNTNQQ